MTEIPHTIKDILHNAREHLRTDSPFCLVRFPKEKQAELYSISENGPAENESFIEIKGWSKLDPPVYFRPEQNEKAKSSQHPATGKSSRVPKETSFENYAEQFQNYQSAFKNTQVQKAILSRIKNIQRPADFDPVNYFQKLNETYSDALVYLVLHPRYGIWMGATPEFLLRKKRNIYSTMSLAGTQLKSTPPYRWGPKEIEEQEMVSTHIREVLSNLDVCEVRESAPETIEAGNVAHIKTLFEFQSAEKGYREIIKHLHPTPAIAGLPVDSAVKLIDKTESHDRCLYSGTIGRKTRDSIDFYVNLRCMQVFESTLSLYLGGGITAASELKSEWVETEKESGNSIEINESCRIRK